MELQLNQQTLTTVLTIFGIALLLTGYIQEKNFNSTELQQLTDITYKLDKVFEQLNFRLNTTRVPNGTTKAPSTTTDGGVPF